MSKLRVNGFELPQRQPIHAAVIQPPRRTRIFAIREEVPFDLWFQDYTRYGQNPIEGRAFAFGTQLAGFSTTTIGAIRYSYARILNKQNCDQRWKELKDQWHGVTLTSRAMLSPEDAIDRFLDFWKKPQNIRDNRHLTFQRYS